MDDGYDFNGPDPEEELSELGEYVTEYVDGTMDPAVREAFEEYLEANPRLLEYICSLSDVRCALRDLNCSCQAPSGVQARLRRRISGDMVADEEPSGLRGVRRLGVLTAAATTLVLLSVGTIWMVESPDEATSGASEDAAEVAERAGSPPAASGPTVSSVAPYRSEGARSSAVAVPGWIDDSPESPASGAGELGVTNLEQFRLDPAANWSRRLETRHGPAVDGPSFRPPSRIPSGLDNAMVRQGEAAPNAQLLVQFE